MIILLPILFVALVAASPDSNECEKMMYVSEQEFTKLIETHYIPRELPVCSDELKPWQACREICVRVRE